jgi:FkbM family methyltransferase
MTDFFARFRRRVRRAIHLFGTLFIDRRHYAIARRSRFNEVLDCLVQDPDFFFIQVGAHDGVRFDGLYQRVTQISPRGIVIEPLMRYFRRLAINYEDYPGVVAINAALHPSAEFVEIHHADPEKAAAAGLPAWTGGIGSVDPGHHARIRVPDCCMTTTRVPATTFDELLATHGVDHVDLLQIDAEGFDLEILRMFPFFRLKPRLVKYEHDGLESDAQAEAERILVLNGYTVFPEGEDTIGLYEPSLPRNAYDGR